MRQSGVDVGGGAGRAGAYGGRLDAAGNLGVPGARRRPLAAGPDRVEDSVAIVKAVLRAVSRPKTNGAANPSRRRPATKAFVFRRSCGAPRASGDRTGPTAARGVLGWPAERRGGRPAMRRTGFSAPAPRRACAVNVVEQGSRTALDKRLSWSGRDAASFRQELKPARIILATF